jgi:hypothetical protein
LKRREEWRPALEAEIKRWSAMSCDQLISALSADEQVYEIEFESKTLQVEVELLENTESYVHVIILSSDGRDTQKIRESCCRQYSGYRRLSRLPVIGAGWLCFELSCTILLKGLLLSRISDEIRQ